MKKKNLVLTIVGLMLVSFVAIKLIANKNVIDEKASKAITDQQFDVIPVKSVGVSKENLSSGLSESGTFKAVQELKLTAQSQGQITKLAVKKTQFVTKGTLLAVIDNSSLKSQTETAQASLDKAKDDAKRYNNAMQAGGVSKQQLEEALLRVQNAESQLAALKQQSRNFQVMAPMDGVINDIYIEAGSSVAPGTPILEIVDITQVNLLLRLDQKNLADLTLGQKVNVTTEVYPGKVFEGKVTTVNVKTDLSQKIEVGVTVTNHEKTPLLSGMYGHAQFHKNEKTVIINSLVIPRDAIVGSIQNAKVFVINNDSTVTLRSIETGRIVNSTVEILGGLQEHDQVITTGQINLENGTKISVKN